MLFTVSTSFTSISSEIEVPGSISRIHPGEILVTSFTSNETAPAKTSDVILVSTILVVTILDTKSFTKFVTVV